jgi:AsmA protein
MLEGRRKKFGILKILGIAAGLMVAAVIALPFVLNANQFRPALESKLTQVLGREVKVGNLNLSLVTGSLEADEIAIADDPKFGRVPFVHAKSLHAGVEMRPLVFSRMINITSILLEKPEVTLVRTASGDWNFSGLGSGQGATPQDKSGERGVQMAVGKIAIKSLRVADGRVTVVSGGRRPKSYLFDQVNITVRNLSFASVFPFTLTAIVPGGGNAKLDGTAGPLNNSDLSLTPFDAAFALDHFDLVASSFVEPEAGLNGLFSFDCRLVSDGKRARSMGKARVDKLQLVKAGSPAGRPVSLEYSLAHDLLNQSGVFNDLKVSCNKAVAQLHGSYDLRGDDLVIKTKLRGEGMPVEDLEELLQAAGVVLPRGASLQGGTLSLDVDTEGPLEKMVTSGTVNLAGTRLVGYDLGAKVATVASLAGFRPGPVTEIGKLASGVRLTQEGIKVNDFILIMPSLGELTGNGMVAANQELEFKMMARLNPSGGIAGGLARLTRNNRLDVPFFIRGTSSDPRFVPDVKGVAGGLLDSITKRDVSKLEGLFGGGSQDPTGKKKK